MTMLETAPSSDVQVTGSTLDYHSLNAKLNLYDLDGKIQFEADKQAARAYILNHVNANLVSFDSLEEKLKFLVDETYYEGEVLAQYKPEFVKSLYKDMYDRKFRFSTFMGAFKFYTSYALKTRDNKRYLERYEDRVAITALYLGQGKESEARLIADKMITGQFQPATPTILNAGKAHRGELVSCFLVRTEDSMDSISRAVNATLQLSKRGGGVAVCLTNLREAGAPIKGMAGLSSGLIPVAKLLEQSVTYSNQLGQRDGSAAIYMSVHHPDVLTVLDSKRENADERIRLNRLSIGLVMSDIVMQKFIKGEDFYTFSPYDVERETGKPMSDIAITDIYEELVANPRIKKTAVSARKFMKIVAEVQFESGYPYILFEDTANRASYVDGRINMSNLCSEILQPNTASDLDEDLSYSKVGKDISCNLGSLNIANVMRSGDLESVVEGSIRALSAVSDLSNITSVPPIQKGNQDSHAIGLGQMNLAGFLASEEVYYGSEESVDFVSAYFAAMAYYSLKASNKLVREGLYPFVGFGKSKYASGEYFDKYVNRDWTPTTAKGRELFEKYGILLPSRADWKKLKESVMEFGIYNSHLQAVPPTGSISYLSGATASIHPIVSLIEVRKEGKVGRVYVPAYGLTNDNKQYYQDAYEVGPNKIIDVYAAATEHVDQGLSCTLFFTDDASTKDINMAQAKAWKKGLKTLYYVRLRQNVLSGMELEGCVSCQL